MKRLAVHQLAARWSWPGRGSAARPSAARAAATSNAQRCSSQKRGVARQRLLARLAALDDARAARARRRGRSRARCGCPRPSVGRQWPALSPTKKTPSSIGRRAAGGGSSCPGSARLATSRSSARRTVGSLTWSRGSNEPTPTRSSSPAGNDQRVAGAARSARSIHSSRSVAGAVRVDLQAARQRARPAAGSLAARGEHAPPAERVDDQRRAQVAAVGVDGVRRVAPVDLGRLELGRRAPARAAARTARGSRRSRTSTAASSGRVAVRRVDDAGRGRSGGSTPRARGASQPLGRAPRTREVWRSPTS